MFGKEAFFCLVGVMCMCLLMHVSVESANIVVGKFFLDEVKFCFCEDLKVSLDVLKPSVRQNLL